MPRREEISTLDRWIITIFSGLFWAIVAVVVTVVLEVLGWLPIDERLFGFGLMAVLAVGGAMLAYRYPRVFEVFLWFMP